MFQSNKVNVKLLANSFSYIKNAIFKLFIRNQNKYKLTLIIIKPLKFKQLKKLI